MLSLMAISIVACKTVENETQLVTPIAKVNGVEITRDRFESLVGGEKKNRENEGVDFETEEGKALLTEIEDFVLDDLIRMELVHQFAAQKEIIVSDEELNSYLEELYMFYGGEEAFKEELSEMGYTFDEIKNLIIMDIKTGKIIEQEIDEVELDDEEIRAQYDAFLLQNGGTIEGFPEYEQFKEEMREELVSKKKYEEFSKRMDEFRDNSVIEKFNRPS
jgi:hypothetical protein